MPAPTIVAEALVAVGDPLRTSLRAGAAAPVSAVVRSIAAGVAPAVAADPLPGWLRSDQRYPCARALAALREFHGALLALPVGSGKTYAALAVASVWQRSPVACIVPAALTSQWERTAARLGVRIAASSHERASRGRLPSGTAGLVLIDESHQFRHADIARYGALATFLVGRPALLLSATPVVNCISDLGAQLALALRDDVLAPHGLPSLAALDERQRAVLGAVIIAPPQPIAGMPRRQSRRVAVEPPAEHLGTSLTLIEQLQLSRSPAIAALVRGVLLRALASSPAALSAALRRYHLLLLQHADASAAGRMISRSELRKWAGEGHDQLVMWHLVSPASGGADLDAADGERIHAILEHAHRSCSAVDSKVERLRVALSDGLPTIVFTVSRATVTYLRDRLGMRVAWCTGTQAGIGHAHLPRAAVLDGFRPGANGGADVLVTTEVAAEGLDLQRAARIIHYDLPWTANRLDQREGRAARLGSAHESVEVLRFDPPAAVDLRLRQLEAIVRTGHAPAAIGLGTDRSAWRWRDVVALRHGGQGEAGTAAVRSPHPGALAGYTVHGIASGSGGRRIAGELVWVGADGLLVSDPEWLLSRLEEAATADSCAWNHADAACALDHVSGAIAESLRIAHRARWRAGPGAPPAKLARRLAAHAAAAARGRDGATLACIERARSIIAGGLTAGERRLVDRITASGSDDDIPALAALPPPAVPWTAVEARLTGLILFQRG